MIRLLHTAAHNLYKEHYQYWAKLSRPKFIRLHFFSSERRLISYYRIGFALNGQTGFAAKLLRIFLKHSIERSGNHISFSATLGLGIRFPHPFGIVIGEGVETGEGVLIWQQVTLGSTGRAGQAMEYPRIGHHVRIYTKASIIGPKKFPRASNRMG